VKSSPNRFEAFSAADKATWEKAAKEELHGESPWIKLGRDVGGLTVRPYYSEADVPTHTVRLKPAEGTFRGPRTWYNCPRVVVSDESRANAVALEHLENGADGIFFELTGPVRFSALLANIEWPICSLSFLATRATEKEAAALAHYLTSFKGSARGAWYGPGSERFPSDRLFHSFGKVVSPSTSPSAALAESLRELSQAIRQGSTDAGAICIDAGNDFFLEIAKLRAVRLVWDRLYPSNPPALLVHSWSRAWKIDGYEPHGNMIHATTSAMAAIMGGCDALTIEGEPDDQEMPRRIARNVATILREESRFAKVADPVAGAYFVDHLSGQLADQIYTLIQDPSR
jgi:methylmalonyl-CoA mutase